MATSDKSGNQANELGCWDFFDKVYCISLEDRPDRRNEARSQFQHVGLLDKVEFVIVKKHPFDREQGIYESHIHCMKKGIQADANNILIFEDDIVFERFSAENLDLATHFLSANKGWRSFFLGCLVKKSKRTKVKSLLKVKYRSLAHAYVVNRPFAETVVKKPWQGIPFDSLLRSCDDGCYAIYPSFAFQSGSRSDNDKFLFLEKIRILCGGLRRIQKMNELYHLNRTIIITAHVCLILLGVWMVI